MHHERVNHPWTPKPIPQQHHDLPVEVRWRSLKTYDAGGGGVYDERTAACSAGVVGGTAVVVGIAG